MQHDPQEVGEYTSYGKVLPSATEDGRRHVAVVDKARQIRPVGRCNQRRILPAMGAYRECWACATRGEDGVYQRLVMLHGFQDCGKNYCHKIPYGMNRLF